MSRFVVLLVLVVGCGSSSAKSSPAKAPPAPVESAQEQPIPGDLREAVERSSVIGHQLYVLDQVASLGTDVLFENVPDAQDRGLAGYLPLREGDASGKPKDSFVVSFFTADAPPRIAYEVRIERTAPPSFQAFTPPKETVPGFAALARARQLAIAARPASNQPVNPVVLPSRDSDDVLVYLLAGTNRPNVAVFGQHFRAVVPRNGSAVSSMTALSNTALEIPISEPSGGSVSGLVVTHTLTDFPLETHVFTSLLVKLPVFVGTQRGAWRVTGDRIAYLGRTN